MRPLGLLLLVGGLLVGSVLDELPALPSLHAAGYTVLVGDFHVHAFPADGALPPGLLRDEARRRGIDVIAVTNHNQVMTGRFAERMSRDADDPLMIAGEEITSRTYHLIGLGLTRRVRNDQPAAQAIADIHAQGGVAIAAHPIQAFTGWTDAAIAALDGVEVAHPIVYYEGAERAVELAAFRTRAFGIKPTLSAVGSSDVHNTPTLGICRTFLFVRERTVDGVLDALRAGRSVAMDRDGQLYGDPELARMVRELPSRRPIERHPSLRRLSVVMAFAGLLGLLCGGRREVLANSSSGLGRE